MTIFESGWMKAIYDWIESPNEELQFSAFVALANLATNGNFNFFKASCKYKYLILFLETVSVAMLKLNILQRLRFVQGKRVVTEASRFIANLADHGKKILCFLKTA